MITPLRIGVLSAAPIAVHALIRPARQLPDVAMSAVAARDPARARRYAAQHHIPAIHRSYAALLGDPAIDAVYIALPNSLHAEWAIRALRAGKHVLCEKPLAANAAEAEQVARAAEQARRVLLEGFHYRYHPLAARLKAIVESGELGQVLHIETEFSVPLLQPRSIQYRYDLGGGATMDVGCYAINLLRFLAGAEPRVAHAEARLIRPQVDRLMSADFSFDDGRTGHMVCALLSARLLRASASVYGSAGELHVTFPFLPHHFHSLTVHSGGSVRHERLEGQTTYFYQLQAFARATRAGTSPLTGAADAIANMRVIDAVYQAAGLRPRGLAEPSSFGPDVT
jgi:predicted dehydrogenase